MLNTMTGRQLNTPPIESSDSDHSGIIYTFIARVKATFCVILFLGCIGVSADNFHGIDHQKLPELGASAQRVLSRAEERRLGQEFYRSIMMHVQTINDPLIHDYISTLGQKLIANSEVDPDINPVFNFFVVKDNVVNAFAGPDGYIGVHAGLMFITQSEHELASVIAHEIAHVTQQHIARFFEKADVMNIPNIAAMLASIALATQNSEAGQAAIMATMATQAQIGVNTIRNNEKEADRVGIEILSKAGFDPYSMPKFFQRMQKEVSRFESRDMPTILSTHPVTESRISDSLHRAGRFSPKNVSSSLDYHLMLARLKVLMGHGDQALKASFSEDIEHRKGRAQLAAQYGQALLALKDFNLKVAQKLSKQLYESHPDVIAFRILWANVHEELKAYDKAIEILQKSIDKFPSNVAIAHEYVDLLLAAKQSEQALDYITDYHLNYRADSPLMYFYLAEANGQLKKTIAAYEAKAEQMYLVGELNQAIKQLRYALAVESITSRRSNIINARINQLKKELEESV